jgi:transcriptional regulator of acetoin/glycerol metabolism
MEQAGGNVTQAARVAGVERETLHRLLRRHGLDPATWRG